MSIEVCPLCAADLVDKRTRERVYSRAIGVVVRGVYDGTAYWMCPDCGGAWHRFPDGDRVRMAVDPVVRARNSTRDTA